MKRAIKAYPKGQEPKIIIVANVMAHFRFQKNIQAFNYMVNSTHSLELDSRLLGREINNVTKKINKTTKNKLTSEDLSAKEDPKELGELIALIANKGIEDRFYEIVSTYSNPIRADMLVHAMKLTTQNKAQGPLNLIAGSLMPTEVVAIYTKVSEDLALKGEKKQLAKVIRSYPEDKKLKIKIAANVMGRLKVEKKMDAYMYMKECLRPYKIDFDVLDQNVKEVTNELKKTRKYKELNKELDGKVTRKKSTKDSHKTTKDKFTATELAAIYSLKEMSRAGNDNLRTEKNNKFTKKELETIITLKHLSTDNTVDKENSLGNMKVTQVSDGKKKTKRPKPNKNSSENGFRNKRRKL